MQSIIIKRSTLGKIPYPQSDMYNIKRALTVKEALNKQSKEKVDVVIIEGVQEDNIESLELLVKSGATLNKETLLVLLAEPGVNIDQTKLDSLRNTVGNTRQVILLEKYNTGETYDNIFPEISIFYQCMNPPAPEDGPSAEASVLDHNLEEQVKNANVEQQLTDTEELLNIKYQLASVTEELRIAQEFIKRMLENPEVTELPIGGAEASRLYEENDKLQSELSRLKDLQNKIDEYEARIKDLSTSEQAERAVTDMWKNIMLKVHDYGQIMKRENTKYNKTASEAEEKVKGLQESLSDERQVSTEQKIQLDKLMLLNADLRDKNEELQVDLKTAIDSGKQLKAKIDELDNIITNLTNEKRMLSMELNKANAEVAKLNTYDVEQLRRQASDVSNVQELLESKLRTIKEQLNTRESQLKQASKEIANARTKIEQLTNEKRILESLLDGETYNQTGIVWQKTVQTRLLAFIGHGGQGCTSIASAVARRLFELGKSVVVVDCDFRAPKMHAIFKVNPIIEYTRFPNLSNSELKTSLGKLLVIKDEVYNNFEQELIIPVVSNKKGRIDLLSGLIASRGTSEISGLDLNTLFVELAAKYDYIIVDLGRSEGTGGIARQQAAIMKNANRKFIVTNNNLDCVKSVISRLVQARIEIDNTEIVFNLVQEKNDANLNTFTSRVKRTYSITFDKHMAGKIKELPSTDTAVKQIVMTEMGES